MNVARITRRRWQCPPYYDDEALLVRLRLTYPKLSWTEITNIFNKHVPPERHRTPDAISNKGPLLMKAYNDDQAATQNRPNRFTDYGSGSSQVRSLGI